MNKEIITARKNELTVGIKSLVDKLQELDVAKNNATASLQATQGAIQDCDYWLAVIEAEEAAKAASNTNEAKSDVPEEAKESQQAQASDEPKTE